MGFLVYGTATIAVAFDISNVSYNSTQQAALMRRSIVLSLPLQLVFLAPS
jgi:hypothetical protein